MFETNYSINLSTSVTDFRSRTKTVVSSAYCTTFNSFIVTWMPWMFIVTWMPLIESFRFKAHAKSSIPSRNTIPDKGQQNSSLQGEEVGGMTVIHDATRNIIINYADSVYDVRSKIEKNKASIIKILPFN